MKKVFILTASIFDKHCVFLRNEVFVGESIKVLERLKVLLEQTFTDQGLRILHCEITSKTFWKESNLY